MPLLYIRKKETGGRVFHGSTEGSFDIAKQVNICIKSLTHIFWVLGHQPRIMGRDSSWHPVLLECTDANVSLCQLERLFNNLSKKMKRGGRGNKLLRGSIRDFRQKNL